MDEMRERDDTKAAKSAVTVTILKVTCRAAQTGGVPPTKGDSTLAELPRH